MKEIDPFAKYESKSPMGRSSTNDIIEGLIKFGLPLIVVCLICVGGYLYGSGFFSRLPSEFKTENNSGVDKEKAENERVRSVRGKIIEKRYVPETTREQEKFLLLYTNTEGVTYSINDRRFYSRVVPGDSVMVSFNYTKNMDAGLAQLNFLDVRKININKNN